jgi:hypothetical protein
MAKRLTARDFSDKLEWFDGCHNRELASFTLKQAPLPEIYCSRFTCRGRKHFHLLAELASLPATDYPRQDSNLQPTD